MSGQDGHILFEIYKLHTELAERVASLREGVDKLYTGMVTAILAASAVLDKDSTRLTCILPILGLVVSLSWLVSSSSITGRLKAKHIVLVDLEEKLPFDFLRRENKEFDQLASMRRKWSGMAVPTSFLVLCVTWLVVDSL